jgi:hypothetical protein
MIGSGEDTLCAVGWKECYLLVLPMVKVTGCGMSPVLVSGYRLVRVVWDGQLVDSARS